MKRALCLFLCAACAGAPASKAPPAPSLQTEGDTSFGSVEGVQVVVKRVPHAELAAVHLFLRGGVRNWSKDDAGIERLALQLAAQGGTRTLDKEALGRRLSELGSTLEAQTTDDWSVLQAKCLTENFEATFGLLADAFLKPALPDGELDLQRQRQLADLKREQEVPDLRLSLLLHQAMYQGHPYQNRAIGTLDSVSKLTRAQLDAHLAKLREKDRLLVVVVGDVNPARLGELAAAAFGKLPAGSGAALEPLPKLSYGAPALLGVEQKLPTNYIEGAFSGPSWKDPDFAAMVVAMATLGQREFLEVRSKRNLSYAPSAGFTRVSELPWGFLYVTAVDPNATMKVMLDEARRLQNEPVPPAELEGNKATYLTAYLMSGETTDGQATRLGVAQILGGDFRIARQFVERVKAVTPAEVQAAAKKHLGRMQFVLLGDPAKADAGLLKSL